MAEDDDVVSMREATVAPRGDLACVHAVRACLHAAGATFWPMAKVAMPTATPMAPPFLNPCALPLW